MLVQDILYSTENVPSSFMDQKKKRNLYTNHQRWIQEQEHGKEHEKEKGKGKERKRKS